MKVKRVKFPAPHTKNKALMESTAKVLDLKQQNTTIAKQMQWLDKMVGDIRNYKLRDECQAYCGKQNTIKPGNYQQQQKIVQMYVAGDKKCLERDYARIEQDHRRLIKSYTVTLTYDGRRQSKKQKDVVKPRMRKNKPTTELAFPSIKIQVQASPPQIPHQEIKDNRSIIRANQQPCLATSSISQFNQLKGQQQTQQIKQIGQEREVKQIYQKLQDPYFLKASNQSGNQLLQTLTTKDPLLVPQQQPNQTSGLPLQHKHPCCFGQPHLSVIASPPDPSPMPSTPSPGPRTLPVYVHRQATLAQKLEQKLEQIGEFRSQLYCRDGGCGGLVSLGESLETYRIERLAEKLGRFEGGQLERNRRVLLDW